MDRSAVTSSTNQSPFKRQFTDDVTATSPAKKQKGCHLSEFEDLIEASSFNKGTFIVHSYRNIKICKKNGNVHEALAFCLEDRSGNTAAFGVFEEYLQCWKLLKIGDVIEIENFEWIKSKRNGKFFHRCIRNNIIGCPTELSKLSILLEETEIMKPWYPNCIAGEESMDEDNEESGDEDNCEDEKAEEKESDGEEDEDEKESGDEDNCEDEKAEEKESDGEEDDDEEQEESDKEREEERNEDVEQEKSDGEEQEENDKNTYDGEDENDEVEDRKKTDGKEERIILSSFSNLENHSSKNLGIFLIEDVIFFKKDGSRNQGWEALFFTVKDSQGDTASFILQTEDIGHWKLLAAGNIVEFANFSWHAYPMQNPYRASSARSIGKLFNSSTYVLLAFSSTPKNKRTTAVNE